jgi:signal transduction histidine kinase/CheY-like chemotaxis protein
VHPIGLRTRLLMIAAIARVPAFAVLAWAIGRRFVAAGPGSLQYSGTANIGGDLVTASLVFITGTAVAVAVVFFYSGRHIQRPIDRLLACARDLAAGDLSARTALTTGAPELRELSRAFDQMAATLEDRERRVRESQRLEAFGQLAGGVAHDFNNMLTVILGFAHTLEAEPLRPEARENLAQIVGAADRAGTLTSQLLSFSRRRSLQPRAMEPNEIVHQVGSMLRQVIGADIVFQTVLAVDVGTIRADDAQLEQVVMNLVLNARDAMPDGGTLTIETSNMTLRPGAPQLHVAGDLLLPPGEYVTIAVRDTGVGMDADLRAHIFEPFFTTKGERGTGLGLAMVHSIATQSGGFIGCASAPGKGTTMTVFLPRIEDTIEVVAPFLLETSAPAGAETILVVEDETPLRVLVDQVLSRSGYRVVSASGAAEAIEHIRGGLRPALVLTDLIMPHMNGVTLAHSLRLLLPGLRLAFMSGRVDHPLLIGEGAPPAHVIQKPFTSDELLRTVRAVLDGAPARVRDPDLAETL